MRTRTVAGAAVFIVLLAACGSSSGSKSSSSTPSTSGSGSSATSETTAAGTSPVVKTASNAKFGTIVVDANGATLYTLTNNGQSVPCTSSACTSVWPPLLLPAGVSTATGTGVGGLGTTAGPGGTQVTQGGLPLYRFAGDTTAGSTNGDGISSFGGVWHVVKIGGATSSGAGGATTSSSSSGGYGY